MNMFILLCLSKSEINNCGGSRLVILGRTLDQLNQTWTADSYVV